MLGRLDGPTATLFLVVSTVSLIRFWYLLTKADIINIIAVNFVLVLVLGWLSVHPASYHCWREVPLAVFHLLASLGPAAAHLGVIILGTSSQQLLAAEAAANATSLESANPGISSWQQFLGVCTCLRVGSMTTGTMVLALKALGFPTRLWLQAPLQLLCVAANMYRVPMLCGSAGFMQPICSKLVADISFWLEGLPLITPFPLLLPQLTAQQRCCSVMCMGQVVVGLLLPLLLQSSREVRLLRQHQSNSTSSQGSVPQRRAQQVLKCMSSWMYEHLVSVMRANWAAKAVLASQLGAVAWLLVLTAGCS